MRRLLVAASLVLVALAGGGCGGSSAEAGPGPLPTFQFKVTIDGVGGGTDAVGYFRSVGGLTMETEVVDYEDGGVQKKRPGRAKYSNIVLKRGYAGTQAIDPLLDWFRTVHGGQDIRKNIAVTIQRAQQGTEAAQYNFENCFPVKWSIPDMDSDQSGLLEEKIEIAVERMSIK